MIHPHTELREVDDRIGLGVFATQRIPRGTIVWVLDTLDQRFPADRVLELGRHYRPLLERFAYLNAAGERVLCWDLARWLNHSCDPNVLSTGWELDVAVRDIEAGDEITTDYGCLNLERSFRCWCRARGCRSRVRPDDFERLADHWDACTRGAFPDAGKVPQPLWKWVPDRRRVGAAVANPLRMPSIRQHRLAPEAATGQARAVAGAG